MAKSRAILSASLGLGKVIMRVSNLVLACLASLTALSAPRAAEVTCSFDCNQPLVHLVLKGEIRPGDFAKVQSLVPPNLEEIPNRMVWITSPGGDVYEAMKIGRWLRQHEFTVSAFKHCASACIFLLSAGVNRVVMPGAAIAIHRPYLLELPQGENVQQAMRDLLRLSKAYFAEMNMPENLADDMFSIEPAKSRKLSTREVSAYRLDQEDLVYQEQWQLEGARRLGISRGEYLKRWRDYQDSGTAEACRREIFTTENADIRSCMMNAFKRFGLW